MNRKSLNRSIVESFNRGDSPGVRPSPGAATSGRLSASDLPRAIRPSNDAAPGDGRAPGQATVQRSHANSGFTMVEIALCIAIIGFALVAIIGVLPTAMRVQQDNRGDTIIDQDGNYFLEAIRNGARGIDDLTNYVETLLSSNNYPVRIVSSVAGNFVTNLVNPREYDTGEKLIGLLSNPRTNDDNFRVEVEFQAISGAAVEKDPNSPVAFKYVLTSEITPFPSLDSLGGRDVKSHPQNILHEVSLTFRWPLSPNTGQVGNNKRVFRTLSSSHLKYEPLGSLGHFFFEPANFVPNSP